MLRHFTGMIVSVLLFAGTTLAQFEGLMDMKVTGAEGRTEENILYTIALKGNLMSTEIKNRDASEGSGKFIFRGDKQVVWILNDQEKSYLEISLKEGEKKEKGKKNRDAEKFDGKIKKTGKKETILGYECEEIIVESEEGVTHLWGTEKLGEIYGTMMKSFSEMGGQDGDDPMGWNKEIAKLRMFPLKVVSKEENKIVMTQEVTRIEPKKMSPSAFDVPKDYEKQTFDFDIEKMIEKMEKQGKKHNENDKDDPGDNIDMEKLMKQLKEMQNQKEDTTDGGF